MFKIFRRIIVIAESVPLNLLLDIRTRNLSHAHCLHVIYYTCATLVMPCNKFYFPFAFSLQSYILLVPKASYSTSLLELESSGRVNQFLQNCGKDHFYLDTTRGRQCREDVFSLTIRFNGEPLKCSCNVLGSRSGACDEFGGQCLCRTDVVGRKCDRCKLGHSGFPRCRRK